MIEDELVRIWQSSPNQERVKFDTLRLMLEVQAGIDRLDRLIKYRDLREIIAVAIIIPAFIYIGFNVPFTLSRIACGLIILYALFVLMRIKKAAKHKPGPVTDSYLDYLKKSRTYLTNQKDLHDSILYWYILPGHLGVTLFTLGTGNMPYIIRMQIFGLILCVVTYYFNKRAVKKTLLPRLNNVEKLIAVLETEQKD